MTILQMIAEWRKGCSDFSPESPRLCDSCTRSLIDAIERRERAGFHGNGGEGGDGIIDIFVSESGELIGAKSQGATYFAKSKIHQVGDVQN